MLVLSRRKNESIVVGPSESNLIEVVVVEIRGDKVRLGIQAPRDWQVCHRKEVYEAIHRGGQQAGEASEPSI